jgi:phage I-like protein
VWQNGSVQDGNTPTLRLLAGLTKLDASQPLPSRIKILNWGRNDTVHGPVFVSERTAASFTANQYKLGRVRVALDFEHNTVPGTEEYQRTQEPRPVAAFGAAKLVPNDGLYLESLGWTPDGKKSAFNFEDLSAAPFLDAEGHVLALHSAALTKNGATYDLPTFFDQAEIKAMSASLTNQQHNTHKTMAEKFLSLAVLAATVGLADTATESDVIIKLKERLAPPQLPDLKPLTASIEALDARFKKIEEAGNKAIATLSATVDGKVVTLNAEDLVKLQTEVKTLSATLTASSTKAEETERTQLIEQATREGKVIPLSAEGIKTVPTPALKEMIAGLPKGVVPLSARKSNEHKQSGDLKGRARAAAAINAQFGQ